MRSLDFSIDLTLPAALWPCPLTEIFLGVKNGRPERKANTLAAICDPIF
jgi:hypothetical protein